MNGRHFTGKECQKCGTTKKYVKGLKCVQCAINRSAEWQKQNKDRHLEVMRGVHADYRARHPDRVKSAKKKYSETDKARIVRARANKKFVTRHPDKKREADFLNKSARRSSTPDWLTKADRAEIEGLAQFCRVMRSITGNEYHIDHIVPIRGDGVCGLHVPWNLQAVPATENLRKSNKLFSDLLAAA
jgi:hypothetical protein